MFKIDKVRSRVGLKHFSVPEEGFVVNIRIQDAMDIELNAFKINSVYEDCKKVLNESTNNISTLEALQKDPESYIYDYFGEIIRQVDLRREELKSSNSTAIPMKYLTLTSQPHQKIRLLEIFFRILNIFALVSNLQKKKFNFCQNPQK